MENKFSDFYGNFLILFYFILFFTMWQLLEY